MSCCCWKFVIHYLDYIPNAHANTCSRHEDEGKCDQGDGADPGEVVVLRLRHVPLLPCSPVPQLLLVLKYFWHALNCGSKIQKTGNYLSKMCPDIETQKHWRPIRHDAVNKNATFKTLDTCENRVSITISHRHAKVISSISLCYQTGYLKITLWKLKWQNIY